jgi:hypothetical protein
VLCIVFPRTPASFSYGYFVGVFVSINVPIYVDIPIDVYIYFAMPPVAASPGIAPGSPSCHTDAKGKQSCAGHVSGRIVIVGRIGRIPPDAINHCRIIGWDIDDLRA